METKCTWQDTCKSALWDKRRSTAQLAGCQASFCSWHVLQHQGLLMRGLCAFCEQTQTQGKKESRVTRLLGFRYFFYSPSLDEWKGTFMNSCYFVSFLFERQCFIPGVHFRISVLMFQPDFLALFTNPSNVSKHSGNGIWTRRTQSLRKSYSLVLTHQFAGK